MLLIWILALNLGKKAIFPARMPVLRCASGMCSSVADTYAPLLEKFSHQVDDFVRCLRADVFSPEFYHSISAELGSSDDPYALFFEEVVPSASRVDYFVYNAFLNVVTEPMVSMATSRMGTNLGYGITVKETASLADTVYLFLRTTARHIVSTTFEGIAIPGVPGFLVARQAAYGYTVATLHNQDAGVPESFTSDIAMHNIVKELAFALGKGAVLPQTTLGEYIFSRSIKLPSIFMTDSVYSYKYPFIIAFAGSSQYDGRVVFSNGTTHRELKTSGDNWHLVQTSKPYNVSYPLRSDFRITQLERAQSAALTPGDSDLQAFDSTLRVFPFRTNMTSFLAAFSGSGEHTSANLQSCVPIRDTTKQVVSCADPPPPTSWASVIFSVILITVIVFLWVHGIRNASYINKLEEYRAKHPEKIVLDPYEQHQLNKKRATEKRKAELERFKAAQGMVPADTH